MTETTTPPGGAERLTDDEIAELRTHQTVPWCSAILDRLLAEKKAADGAAEELDRALKHEWSIKAEIVSTLRAAEASVVSLTKQLDTAKGLLAKQTAVLRAIAEGYSVRGEDDRYVVVENPAFQPDNGEDPSLVFDLYAGSDDE